MSETTSTATITETDDMDGDVQVVAVAEHNGVQYRAVLVPDQGEDSSPREATNMGTMVVPHRSYVLGDENGRGRPSTAPLHDMVRDRITDDSHAPLRADVVARWLRAFHGATVVLPLGMLDHSGLHMWVGGGSHWSDPQGWDSGTVGFIFDTPEGRREWVGEDTVPDAEEVEAALRSEVEEYDRYLRGEVYGVYVQRLDTWTNKTTGGEVESWEQEDDADSAFGLIGHEYATTEARGFLRGLLNDLTKEG